MGQADQGSAHLGRLTAALRPFKRGNCSHHALESAQAACALLRIAGPAGTWFRCTNRRRAALPRSAGICGGSRSVQRNHRSGPGRRGSLESVRALSCVGLDDNPAALDVLQTALDLTPDDADLNMSMAVVCRRLKLVARAIEHCRKALAVRANLPAAHAMLGELLENAGDTDGAVAAYEQAVSLQPDLRGLRERLFMLYHNQGRNTGSGCKQLDNPGCGRWPDDGMRITRRHAVRARDFPTLSAEIEEACAPDSCATGSKRCLQRGPAARCRSGVRGDLCGLTPFPYLAYHAHERPRADDRYRAGCPESVSRAPGTAAAAHETHTRGICVALFLFTLHRPVESRRDYASAAR